MRSCCWLREALLRALAELPLGSASNALIGAHTCLVRDELRRRAGPQAGFTDLRRAV
jgi:hypothetical protein